MKLPWPFNRRAAESADYTETRVGRALDEAGKRDRGALLGCPGGRRAFVQVVCIRRRDWRAVRCCDGPFPGLGGPGACLEGRALVARIAVTDDGLALIPGDGLPVAGNGDRSTWRWDVHGIRGGPTRAPWSDLPRRRDCRGPDWRAAP